MECIINTGTGAERNKTVATEQVMQALALQAEGKTHAEIASLMGRSRQRVTQWLKEGLDRPDIPAPVVVVSPEEADVAARFKLARAIEKEAQARLATLKADEQQGRLVQRTLLDDLLLELGATVEVISNRMKKESPASVEILREGIGRFDAWAKDAIGKSSKA